jgi:hypothetical protein
MISMACHQKKAKFGLIRKYLIERDLLAKSAIGVQLEIDFFGYFSRRQGNPAGSRGDAAGPVILP